MAYQSESIAVVVNRLNNRYFLPAIQREFVWQPDQIVRLFDSIMRHYPISSFLFWELQEQNRDKWEVYRFVSDFHQKGTHNETAATDGVQQLTLVLDGQQRLTTLLIGLKGTYTAKKKWKRVNSPDAYAKLTLWLNLLKDPNAEEDDDGAGARYGFSFAEGIPRNYEAHHWIKVGRILDFDSRDRFDEFLDELEEDLPDATPKAQMRNVRRIATRLHDAVWKDETVAYYTEHDQDYDRVLDIFVRANEGGTVLSKSDLLLSMITSKFKSINARDEIHGFVDYLNNELSRKNSFDKDWVMKACLVLPDLPVKYKVDNFSNDNLALIEHKWADIKRSLLRTVSVVNSFGIDRETLTSQNALIPIAYYLFRHPGVTLQRETPFDSETRREIRRWLVVSLLNNVFSGTSDTVLNAVRRVLQRAATEGQAFPVQELNGEVARLGRLSEFSDQTLDNVLDISYGSRQAFLALSLLYDHRYWGTMTSHQDHIFPHPEGLGGQAIPHERWADYRRARDCLANLELLTEQENGEKSNQPFNAWLLTRDSEFRQRHLIPADDDLLRFERFLDFVKARELLIKQRLMQLFATNANVPDESGAVAS
jgi:Protein of unknown function DUF262